MKKYSIPIFEVDSYVLFKEYENCHLFDKHYNKYLWYLDLCFEPDCGLIGSKKDWAIIGGKFLIIWIKDSFITFEYQSLKSIFEIREINSWEVEILTDPWHQDSSIWRLNLQNLNLEYVRKFKDYIHLPYQDIVIW